MITYLGHLQELLKTVSTDERAEIQEMIDRHRDVTRAQRERLALRIKGERWMGRRYGMWGEKP